MTYRFKTNINCLGCVSQIEPVLQHNEAIENWKVDLNDSNHMLTIETNKLTEDEAAEIVRNAGFVVQPV